MPRHWWSRCLFSQPESPNTPITEAGGVFDTFRWDDEYFGSSYVRGLGEDYFKQFLSAREMVLVMFYIPDYGSNPYFKKQFVKAAESNKSGYRYHFAGVDCLAEEDLCAAQGVRNLPAFKLYVRGEFVSSMKEPESMSCKEILKHLEAHRLYRGLGN
ncbi:hypothetical protein BsWGS_16956 [Bradybaena similaris]